MAARFPPTSLSASPDNDIFSLSDAQLAQRYQFVREIGAGNWGCVWLCSPKVVESAHTRAIAVKLVFREKKPTTAQRVRSLWNEMKIVRALKQDPHPSIVPFHSFIITPSFAIITMEYLPQLIPVEVPETTAREWFRCMLSAVLFLHGRGVVHNDIKPANILLSTKKAPVLVDFGFAERYELGSKRAFLSNLAYGTPEYLSPERARGNVHDTRKSDVWSLGITFFEILIGRTPFEYVEGEKFTAPEDLERYWSRTVKGKWVGEWKMSKSIERMLRKMISPNADIRCTASDAMKDVYWLNEIDDALKGQVSNVISPTAAAKTSSKVKKVESRPSTLVFSDKENVKPLTAKKSALSDEKQSRVAARAARRVQQYVMPTIESSPLSSRPAAARGNASPVYQASRVAAHKPRAPVSRKPVPHLDEDNRPSSKRRDASVKEKEVKERNRRSRALLDSSSRSRNVETPKKIPVSHAHEKLEKVKQPDTIKRLGSGSYDRMKAFERLKQLERSRFLEEEGLEEDFPTDQAQETVLAPRSSSQWLSTATNAGMSDLMEHGRLLKRQDQVKDFVRVLPPEPSSPCIRVPSSAGLSTIVDEKSVMAMSFERPRTEDSSFTLFSDFKGTLGRQLTKDEVPLEDPKLFASETFPRSGNDLSLSLFKHGLKESIDKGLRLYKSSTLGRTSVRKASKRTSEELDRALDDSRRESWENDSLIRDAKSSLPVVRHALHNERVAADNKIDRLSLWVRNVEQVVKEAKEKFAASSITPLPALPARPISRQAASRNGVSSRVPRKILAADQIFRAAEVSEVMHSPVDSAFEKTSRNANKVLSDRTEEQDRAIPASPSRARRATISAATSLAAKIEPMDTIDGSPSRRKEKSKSSGNLASLIRPISPLSQLQKDLEREEERSIPNLSEVLDRNVFIARMGYTLPLDEVPTAPIKTRSLAETYASSALGPLTPPPSSVLRETTSSPVLTAPHREGDYDRSLVATTGVKRVGRGYQSDISAPAQKQTLPASAQKKSSRLFGGRSGRARLPPVSNENLSRSGGPDDFGFRSVSYSASTSFMGDASKSVNAVRKAFKAIVTGKSVTRRQPKVL